MTVTQTPTKQDVMRDLEHNTSKEGLEIDDVLLDYIADILLEESMHTGAVTCAADLSSVIGELVAEEEADALNNAIYEGLTASFWVWVLTSV
ncbi:hypothetical protein SARC_10531 [Sphaeroforma arctica JP610]|uniref:Uncharacterized protein n=1 Tax=Sphaeroforma arctica JP610 TaxID=667725 RepID=A0A0L0FLV3_9EUKA|nr:hypothetical protein SARC_10531 [Sphaeroforma arctica JP610]KNC76998.1 hypothetical protein SARC_10531 [Sphaeroforma arctica JP610]|eukprot:XP_014150900.1 hypothetical protein SARC_10531 [Sphaeroforma arctica JP610]